MRGLYTIPIPVIGVALVVLMFFALEIGHRIGVPSPTGERQHGAIATSTLALVGLLLAFSFSMAAERFNSRRRASVTEANAIGTFWLRTSFLREPARAQMRAHVRRYVELHFEYRTAGTNVERTANIEAEAGKVQQEMWALLMQETEGGLDPKYLLLLTNAANDVFDSTSAVLDAQENRLPDPFVVALLILVVVASFVIGYGSRTEKRNFLMWGLLILVLGGVLVILLDLDRPRRGLIHSNTRVYQRLRQSMESD